MAMVSTSMTFTDAVIDLNDNTITEYHDDECLVHNLTEVLHFWENVRGLRITFETFDRKG